MANRFSDALYQLILSLEKSEKRHFKLYIKRSSSRQDLRIVQLFDALEKMPEYDEAVLLKKLAPITKTQLANLKNHLYKQLLASLRLLKSTDNIDLQLSEHLDYARLLYNKGLKLQSLKMLERAKTLALASQKINSMAQVLSLEKKIEILHITRSLPERADELTEQSLKVSGHIDRVTRLSNLTLLLYRWFVNYGHSRDEEDEQNIKTYFYTHKPANDAAISGFYEELYQAQAYCWYNYIRQNFLQYYRWCSKWLYLFDTHPHMAAVETGHYVKGLHNLLNAHFALRNYQQFDAILRRFERFSQTPEAQAHDNFRIHTSVYLNNARINGHLMKGSFKEGLQLLPALEKDIASYGLYTDRHRQLVLRYKIAMLHFGAENYSQAIDDVQQIINGPLDLRMDLQSYARLLHLLAHYEMGNYDAIEPLTKSVFRFMARLKYLTVVEEEIFRFLRQTFGVSPAALQPYFETFLNKIKHLETNRFQTRTFAYLDIISWAESKVLRKPMAVVIQEKYRNSRKRRYAV